MIEPEPGLTTKAYVTRVVDGDTIEVEIRRRFKVRFKDYNADELNTLTGQEAKEILIKRLAEDSIVTLFIPTYDNEKLMDINSFERIVADVWHNGEKLNAN